MKHMITRFIADASLVAIMVISMAVATTTSTYAAPPSDKHSSSEKDTSPTQGTVKESSTSFNLFWD